MLDLEVLDYKASRELLPTLPATLRETNQMMSGDLWRGGLGYDGPMPAPGPNFASDVRLLRRSFVPIPKLHECLRRHVRGVIGREPAFEIFVDEGEAGSKTGSTPNGDAPGEAAPNAEIEAVNSAQGAWWDETDCLITLQLFTAYLRAYGRACLRYDVPPGLLEEGFDEATGEAFTGVAARPFDEVFNLIFAEVCAPGTAGVYRDPATLARVAVYLFEEGSRAAGNVVKCAQVSYLGEVGSDEEGKTIVRVIRENGQNERRVLETGGQLLVLEASLPPVLASVFFSDAMRALQERLSGVATMIKTNANVAGYPERVAIDLEPPTSQSPIPGESGTKEQIVPLATGPRTAPFLASMTDEDEATGETTVRSGTMLFRTPVSSEPLRADADYFEGLIYAATHQRHLTRAIAADASGAALVEWRADYADSLLETRPFIEKILREFLKGTACLAAYFARDEAKLELCKASRWRVDCQLNAGPLSPAEKTEIAARYKAGLLSRETAMVLLGTEDVESEIAKIDEEELRRELGDGFASFEGGDNAGAGEPPAGADAGIPDVKTLNGAQITAALEIINQMKLGSISEVAAVELMVAVGITRETAQTIIDDPGKVVPETA